MKRRLKLEWHCPSCGAEVCHHVTDAMNGHAAEATRLASRLDAAREDEAAVARRLAAAEAEVERLRLALAGVSEKVNGRPCWCSRDGWAQHTGYCDRARDALEGKR